MKSFVEVLALVLVLPLLADGKDKDYFRDEDRAQYRAAVASIQDRQCGELYSMTWSGDYHLKRVLAANCTNMMQTIGFICTDVLDGAPVPAVVTGMGCSAFAATNAVGDQLVGRNFDYRFPMAHVLLYAPRAAEYDRYYASVGTVDAGFAGFDVGSLTNLTDTSKSDYPWHVPLFPYLCMDGMNEAGFMVTVLSLDGRPDAGGQKTRVIEQFVAGHTNIVPTVAIRFLLDHAGSTAEGVAMLTNFNMFAASGPDAVVQANYHFLLSDRSGDTRVVEWLPPAEDGGSWSPAVTNATAVSNFWLADGYGHGSNRWEIMRHALAQQQGHLEAHDAMNLCRAVSQKKGAEQTSWTHWSVVYDLADLTADIATLGNFDEIFPYRLKGSDGWEVGEPKSAHPEVRTDLPAFDASAAGGDKVYLLTSGAVASAGAAPLTFVDGATLSAVSRMGCTYDARQDAVHAVVKAVGRYNAAFYSDMAGRTSASDWPDGAVAGVNERGLSARVVRFRGSGPTGETSPSAALVSALLNCDTAAAAVEATQGHPPVGDQGVVFTDAMGNVGVWPAGSEFRVDDASEMLRNSLDLRKGIYEVDGPARGQFDELPGLLRLASTEMTRAIVSTGYGHIDVALPKETNVVWRVQVDGPAAPAYGVVADPADVAHATAIVADAKTGGDAIRNNQGRLVAETNATLRVTYTAEDGYFFQDGTDHWSQVFSAEQTVATPPAPSAEPRRPVTGLVIVTFDPSMLAGDGTVTLDVQISTSIPLTLPADAFEVWYADSLDNPNWRPAPMEVLAIGPDRANLRVQPPSSTAGFFKVVVK